MAASTCSQPEAIKKLTAKGKRFGQLEALRGFAALYVVSHHIWLELSPNIETSPLRFVLKHGMLAVMVFFVLSGFVIEYSTVTRSVDNFKLYFRKRFARIYPLFLLALLAAYVVNSLRAGHLLQPDFGSLCGNLLMLQGSPVTAGRWFEPYDGNGPLWSLTYEWWFYMMYFPIRKRLPEKYQALFVVGLSIFGLLTNYFIKPNQISMVLTLFIIWWLGVEFARARLREGNTLFRHVWIPLAGALALTLWLFWFAGWSVDLSLVQAAHYQLTSFTYLFAMLGVGWLWQRLRFAGFRQVFGPFERVAPISYSIYIFHAPIVISGAKLFPGRPPVLVYGGLLALLALICYALERPVQKRITRVLVPLDGPRERRIIGKAAERTV